jgi:hypothetical protein
VWLLLLNKHSSLINANCVPFRLYVKFYSAVWFAVPIFSCCFRTLDHFFLEVECRFCFKQLACSFLSLACTHSIDLSCWVTSVEIFLADEYNLNRLVTRSTPMGWAQKPKLCNSHPFHNLLLLFKLMSTFQIVFLPRKNVIWMILKTKKL